MQPPRRPHLSSASLGSKTYGAIQEVKFRYTEGTDPGYDLDKIAAAFTPDGRWYAEGFADCHGRDEIREFSPTSSKS